ncbi:hypothetical protein E2C01_046288 [Portunus trituberculatus]|uniref:Uncharacterized protein n=1 Tax=Portunus trituberculatus TaxID=210409 RepID=A0A5B7G4C9_PORTR|nr:hypothetical protein [Portunus trituberculatus]
MYPPLARCVVSSSSSSSSSLSPSSQAESITTKRQERVTVPGVSGTTGSAGTLQYEVCDDPEAPRPSPTNSRGIGGPHAVLSPLSQCPPPPCSRHRLESACEGYLFADALLSSETRHRVWPDPA